MNPTDQVYRFRIQLDGITPPIWRAIEVPASYTFWDLHVAVQDALGWLDYHLHEFRIRDPRTDATTLIGMPDEAEGDDPAIKRGWETQIVDYFTLENRISRYLYDFGDDWAHTIELEATLPRAKDETYPRCVMGGRACPPEDCGGVGGYELLCADEDEDLREWCPDYDPEDFDAAEVVFDDPTERWQIAFG